MIIGEVRRFLRDNNPVRVSRSMRDMAYKAIQCKNASPRNMAGSPPWRRSRKSSARSGRTWVVALEAIVEPVSLYEPVYDHGGDTLYLMDQVGGGGDQDWLEEIAVKEAIRNLNQREKRILSLRFSRAKPRWRWRGRSASPRPGLPPGKGRLQKIKKDPLSAGKRRRACAGAAAVL